MPRPSLRVPGWGTDAGSRICRGREAPGRACPLTLSLRSQESLARLLSPCGPVKSVELQGKPELTERPKEPKSKFFHPEPVPVSLRSRGRGMGAGRCPRGGGGGWQWSF